MPTPPRRARRRCHIVWPGFSSTRSCIRKALCCTAKQCNITRSYALESGNCDDDDALVVVGAGRQEGGAQGGLWREGAPDQGDVEIFNSNKETLGTARSSLCLLVLPDLYPLTAIYRRKGSRQYLKLIFLDILWREINFIGQNILTKLFCNLDKMEH